MRVRLLVACFFLFVLVVGQGLQSGQAYADCCGCSCMYYCTCSGYYDSQQGTYCWFCRSTEPILQTKAMDEGKEQLPSSKVQPDMVQRVTELRVLRPCLRNKIALALLGDNRETMKFELVRFDEKNAQEQTVAFKVDR